jgi:hypothetical protein
VEDANLAHAPSGFSDGKLAVLLVSSRWPSLDRDFGTVVHDALQHSAAAPARKIETIRYSRNRSAGTIAANSFPTTTWKPLPFIGGVSALASLPSPRGTMRETEISLAELMHKAGLKSIAELLKAEDELQRAGVLRIDRTESKTRYVLLNPSTGQPLAFPKQRGA